MDRSWAASLDDAAGADESRAPESADESAPQLAFQDVGQFVELYLVEIYQRDLDQPGLRWCSSWFYHAEAIARLEALWRAWEFLRLDPNLGMSDWWLGHADPTMRLLMSDAGPFRHCRDSKHADAARFNPLPVNPSPLSTAE